MSKNKPVEIVIWTELSLIPFACETYEEALAHIDGFRDEPNYTPNENLIIHIKVRAGFSKIPLQEFTAKLNLDQIEYHVYW